MMRRVAIKQKAGPIIDLKKQDPFHFVSIWLWCSRCFIIPHSYNR